MDTITESGSIKFVPLPTALSEGSGYVPDAEIRLWLATSHKYAPSYEVFMAMLRRELRYAQSFASVNPLSVEVGFLRVHDSVCPVFAIPVYHCSATDTYGLYGGLTFPLWFREQMWALRKYLSSPNGQIMQNLFAPYELTRSQVVFASDNCKEPFGAYRDSLNVYVQFGSPFHYLDITEGDDRFNQTRELRYDNALDFENENGATIDLILAKDLHQDELMDNLVSNMHEYLQGLVGKKKAYLRLVSKALAVMPWRESLNSTEDYIYASVLRIDGRIRGLHYLFDGGHLYSDSHVLVAGERILDPKLETKVVRDLMFFRGVEHLVNKLNTGSQFTIYF